MRTNGAWRAESVKDITEALSRNRRRSKGAEGTSAARSALGVLVLPLSPEGEDWVAGLAATGCGWNKAATTTSPVFPALLTLSLASTARTADDVP
jgi:hypothetical protein